MAQRLAFEERAAIEAMTSEGLSAERVARALGRDASTVRREVARGGGRGCYCALGAQADADAKASRPKGCKLAEDPVLAAEVAEMMASGFSPHAIAGRFRAEGRPPSQRVCAETIYSACYDPGGGRGLAACSWRELVRGRRRRKPRSRCEQAKRGPLGECRPLRERPAAAGGREEAGHWEGDLIIGARNRSAVVTLVERTSRLTLLGALDGRYSADKVAAAVTAAFARVPAHMAKTLTWDRGSEMPAGPASRPTPASTCTSASPTAPGSGPPTSRTTRCCEDGCPKAPTSTSARPDCGPSRTRSTPCPDASTTGTARRPLHCPRGQPPLELSVPGSALPPLPMSNRTNTLGTTCSIWAPLIFISAVHSPHRPPSRS